jgi:hypothetical protein
MKQSSFARGFDELSVFLRIYKHKIIRFKQVPESIQAL